ncbi:MAG: hypothetical protein HYV59_13115 [Planctomycetes bacterium]|nr:hypothetical protein [Planctomycetota bacterium]
MTCEEQFTLLRPYLIGMTMTVPQEILGLVERFNNNRDVYYSGTYNKINSMEV